MRVGYLDLNFNRTLSINIYNILRYREVLGILNIYRLLIFANSNFFKFSANKIQIK